MNDFSILDEIEKYLLEIFGDKTNALENKQRVYVIFKKIFNNKNRVWKYFEIEKIENEKVYYDSPAIKKLYYRFWNKFPFF